MITTVPTIGCLVGLRLGEAQPFHFGASRLPETRRTEKRKHHQPFQNRKPLGATRCHRLLLKQWNFCWEQQECCLHRELGAAFLLEVKETPFEDDDEDQRQDEQDAEDGDQTFLPSRHLHCRSAHYIYFILHSLVIFFSWSSECRKFKRFNEKVRSGFGRVSQKGMCLLSDMDSTYLD